MTTMFWLLLVGIAAGLAILVRNHLRKWEERKRGEEERFASFMKAGTEQRRSSDPAIPPAPPLLSTPAAGLAQQKMLFEAAHKAGEAGEPTLAIQLYGRLLARYPDTTFAAQARAAVETLKKKLAKT